MDGQGVQRSRHAVFPPPVAVADPPSPAPPAAPQVRRLTAADAAWAGRARGWEVERARLLGQLDAAVLGTSDVASPPPPGPLPPGSRGTNAKTAAGPGAFGRAHGSSGGRSGLAAYGLRGGRRAAEGAAGRKEQGRDGNPVWEAEGKENKEYEVKGAWQEPRCL